MKKKEIKQTLHSIVLYQNDDSNVCVNVYYCNETFWLTQKAMAELFGVNTQAITKHLGNIYQEQELNKEATCSKMEQVQQEGDRQVKRLVDFYNLDAVIAVGYRVNSHQATAFRSTNRRNILADKGTVSHDQAVDKATKEYEIFRIRQDREYISDFDRETEKYLKGEN